MFQRYGFNLTLTTFDQKPNLYTNSLTCIIMLVFSEQAVFMLFFQNISLTFYLLGLVILSKWVPNMIHFHPYTINGSPFKPFHGDWYSTKGFLNCIASKFLNYFVLKVLHMLESNWMDWICISFAHIYGFLSVFYFLN